MSAEAPLPGRLAEIVEGLESLDRSDRIDALISIAGRFREVPESVASRPFPETHRVPACESQAFVWMEDEPAGGLKLHFAVENPQGISAKALAVILDEGLSGERPEALAELPGELVERIFGRELSLGKTMGLSGMVQAVRREAKARRGAATGVS